MEELYKTACLQGTQPVYRTRLMLLGHFAAGKTSVKRSLLCEEFIEEYISTDGVDTEDMCVVDVNTTVNWQKSRCQSEH